MRNNLSDALKDIKNQVGKLRYSRSSIKKFELIKLDTVHLINNLPPLSSHIDELQGIEPVLSSPSFVETYEADKKNAWIEAKKSFVLIVDAIIKIVERDQIESIRILSSVDKIALRNLASIKNQINISEEADFYTEVIKCYEVGAFRSAIVMMWNLTMNHLFDYTLKHKLNEYNTALNSKFGSRAKLVSTKEDFSNYRESDIIEVLKISGVVDKNIRKILDNKLGVRNTFAHPSTLIVAESKAVDVIEDLTRNVIVKFQI